MYNINRMSASDSIPKALQYGASQSQARVVRQTVMPAGTSSGSAGSIVRFMLPQKSIIDLRSLSLYYDYTISGLLNTGAGDYINSEIPASYKHWKSIRFYVSGAVASGGMCQHYDQVYHALVKATGSEDWTYSRLNNHYLELVQSTGLQAQPGATSKTARVTCDDFFGLPNSKNFCIDSSLFGNVEMEIQFNDNYQLKVARATQSDAAALAAAVPSFSNIKLCVDTVVSISPLYVSLLAERLQVDTPIRLPFQEIRSIVSANTGSNRLTLNGACIDALVVCPFNADPNVNVAQVVGTSFPNNPHYKFNSGRTEANANETRVSIQVGSEVFPRTPVSHATELADITMNSLYGNSAQSKNLLYYGVNSGTDALPGAMNLSRLNFLTDNAVLVNKFSLNSEGWADGVMSGLNCAGSAVDFVVNTTNFGTHLLIASLQTSCLVFDPRTSAISIES